MPWTWISQSYHTGIEIREMGPDDKKKESLNRTILELKYCFGAKKSESRCSQSYHTGIEIPITISNINQSSLSIVPYWNWNIFVNETSKLLAILSIVPYWNWNSKAPGLIFSLNPSQSYHTGIEIEIKTRTALDDYTLNRTILELKYYRW